ncbi:MAG: N-acyl-D-amino-acid deacylase family protein [Rhodocyclaceae bacterium]
MNADLLFRGVRVIDGSGEPGFEADVAVCDGRIAAIGDLAGWRAAEVVQGEGLCLAPGFIDVHTHDDTNVIRSPGMLPKLSQGVTTVVVGNCGISAAPVRLRDNPPDPMNLLGRRHDFVYPSFADYAAAVDEAVPAVNVVALVGHTALRANHMDDLYRAATPDEIARMRDDLRQALEDGAIGLSSGLAYASAHAAPTGEVMALVEELAAFGGIYTTHLRSEFAEILAAMEEAFAIARHGRVPVVLSHHKCAGLANWGRTRETLAFVDRVRRHQRVALDCYPYAGSSSTLDLKQVTDDYDILITWSEPEPGQAGRTLKQIADGWGVSLLAAAARLQPAGAVYHCMDEADVERVLAHPRTMIGSDGLPNDPLPHPRLWGAFPRVLGRYSRERRLLPLEVAIHKMTGLSAAEFGLAGRGRLQPGCCADLVLFDPETIADTADYERPLQQAVGIERVVVNGVTSFRDGRPTGDRAGRMLRRRPLSVAHAALISNPKE